jgi:dTMP kinase
MATNDMRIRQAEGSDAFFSCHDIAEGMSAMAQVKKSALVTTESKAIAEVKRGLFVVFEGIDGSGKTTAVKGVYDVLSREMPGKVVLTAEPTETWIGDCVRRANQEKVGSAAEALLFVADRAEHTERIKNWLAEGKVVLCDRYFLSTIAYQGAALRRAMGAKRAIEWLKSMNQPIIVRPDLTLLFTLSVQKAMDRLQARQGRTTKFEELEYLLDVDLIYRSSIMEDPSVFTIDASRPVHEVVETALKVIRGKI